MTRTWWLIVVAAAALALLQCDDGGGDGDADGDTDADTDADTDSDSDADADTDTDTDTDVDGDTDTDTDVDTDVDGDTDTDVDGDTDTDTDGDTDVDADSDADRPEGSIVVEPANRRWLFHDDGTPFFMCGPGDPEAFLYLGDRQADGTRDGNQLALIERLGPTGANTIYFQAIRSHGGDGSSNHNPFVDSDENEGLDEDILDQWEVWLDAMDAQGIVPLFFFYDDSACVWGCGSSDHEVPAEEEAFLQAIVNRFEHHPRLIWAVAEEYSEAFSATRASNIASVIREADDFDHPIAVHKLSGVSFDEFADDPNIDQFAMQLGERTPSALHSDVVAAFEAANGRYGLNMSESANHGTGAIARQRNWAAAMGGAYAMVLGWNIDEGSTPLSDLEQCGYMVSFMEGTRFDTMVPDDARALGLTNFVLVNPSDRFILYSMAGPGDLGVTGVDDDEYDLTWVDAISGATSTETGVSLSGNVFLTPPGGFGAEVAVYIRRTGG